MKSKFRCRDVMGANWKALDMYRVEQFQSYMLVISQRYPRVAEYLEHQVGFDKWSQCHFPRMRYNITTTNVAESLNNMLLTARNFPYITLLDVIQGKMSKWWNKRRTVGMNFTSPLTPN